MSEKWKKDPFFQKREEIINAGIEAYFQTKRGGYINCIKNLYSEMEGIIREHYVSENGEDPNFRDLRNYILEKSRSKFPLKGTVAFPKKFCKYLDNSIFDTFNLLENKIPLSRHTTGHGVAKAESYTRIKAFQAILTLDQIYHYLS